MTALIIIIKFGTTTKELTEKIGEQMCNLKIISKHNDFTFELFGVISSDGKSATIDGSSGVFMLEWVTEKEAEIIGKLNPLTLFSYCC